MGLAVTAAAAPSQTAPPEPGPAALPDPMAASLDQIKRNTEALNKVPLPMATEPAFSFKP
jgi:hypothetical protein